MVREWKRRLLLGLGLSVALTLAAVSPAPAVSTLTGETLSGSSSQGNTPECFNPTYSVSGAATGPYPGSFSETGSWNLSAFPPATFTAAFTITSGTTTITGSKARGSSSFFSCSPVPAEGHLTNAPYTATINTPNGDFHDEGLSAVDVIITRSQSELTESFTSSLPQPVLIAPTSKDQCKNGGWKAFPQFKNQGECVSFVERQRRT